jgi:magnesium-protoporphyrin IX monomethyl ester (oxidative) cyclase
MYLNDLQRSSFYATLGLDARKFDIHVIKKTNQSAGRLFPIILDVDNPDFFRYLDQCAEANLRLIEVDAKEKDHYGHIGQNILYFFLRSVNYSIIVTKLLQIMFMKPLDSQKYWNTIY